MLETNEAKYKHTTDPAAFSTLGHVIRTTLSNPPREEFPLPVTAGGAAYGNHMLSHAGDNFHLTNQCTACAWLRPHIFKPKGSRKRDSFWTLPDAAAQCTDFLT